MTSTGYGSKTRVGDRVRTLRCAAIAMALSAPWSLATAQYDPGATLDLGMGYGQNALSQSAMRNVPDDTAAGASGADDDYAGSGMSRDARLKKLREEYASRLVSDGAASANAWATEMGRRDARAEND